MAKTKIEWTEQTWNPIVGCSVVSPGCTNCYAMKMAARIESMGSAPQYNGTTKESRGGPVWTGKVALAEKALLAPLKRKKPTMYFVNSMGDLFHEDVPDEWIDRVFAVMALTPQHTFQVLTTRAERMRKYVTRLYSGTGFLGNAVTNLRLTVFPYVMTAEDAREKGPFPNVWLGVSAEDQTRADERIPHLLETPAAVRFVSCEPLLGPVDLRYTNRHTRQLDDLTMRVATNALTGDTGYTESCCFPEEWSIELTSKLDWVIVGGESGPNARPMHPDWVRSLRGQCQDAGVPFFFKQWGEWVEIDGSRCRGHPGTSRQDRGPDVRWMKLDGTVMKLGHRLAKLNSVWGTEVRIKRIGKRAAGSLLDGRAWNEMPG